mmetsp:Transcript_58537/g.169451  ORF Transcript_58537/g.169451 Transcript_58537/m.169451 type:complete len:264 (-) Transcript_58537:22-813(-)
MSPRAPATRTMQYAPPRARPQIANSATAPSPRCKVLGPRGTCRRRLWRLLSLLSTRPRPRAGSRGSSAPPPQHKGRRRPRRPNPAPAAGGDETSPKPPMYDPIPPLRTRRSAALRALASTTPMGRRRRPPGGRPTRAPNAGRWGAPPGGSPTTNRPAAIPVAPRRPRRPREGALEGHLWEAAVATGSATAIAGPRGRLWEAPPGQPPAAQPREPAATHPRPASAPASAPAGPRATNAQAVRLSQGRGPWRHTYPPKQQWGTSD